MWSQAFRAGDQPGKGDQCHGTESRCTLPKVASPNVQTCCSAGRVLLGSFNRMEARIKSQGEMISATGGSLGTHESMGNLKVASPGVPILTLKRRMVFNVSGITFCAHSKSVVNVLFPCDVLR